MTQTISSSTSLPLIAC